MTQPLDENLQGLAAVLIDLLVRELERETVESAEETDEQQDTETLNKLRP